jgi:hypothetical protein
MARVLLLIAGCLAGIVGSVWSQEVVITGFPVGVGGSIEPQFFRTYYPELQTVADTLRHNPAARAIVTGGADGIEYHESHDAKNPGLALGRAHVLRNLLVVEFGVDSTQLVIETLESPIVGGAYRYVGVLIVSAPTSDIDARLDALENRPPVEKHFTEMREVPSGFIENLGLQVSAGLTSSPFGALPMAAGAVTWKRVFFVEAVFGYTVWDGTYRFMSVDLETRRRLAGFLAAYYPKQELPVGVIAGWVRAEEISQRYYDFVRMSEGPMFGLRATPLDYLSVTVAYNPSKHRVAGETLSQSKNNQFLISIIVHKTFGGGK